MCRWHSVPLGASGGSLALRRRQGFAHAVVVLPLRYRAPVRPTVGRGINLLYLYLTLSTFSAIPAASPNPPAGGAVRAILARVDTFTTLWTGAALAAFGALVVYWIGRLDAGRKEQEERRGHLRMLRAEIRRAGELAAGYLGDNVLMPTTRLPQGSYLTSAVPILRQRGRL